LLGSAAHEQRQNCDRIDRCNWVDSPDCGASADRSRRRCERCHAGSDTGFPGSLPKSDSLPDYFAGLNYTDDQKAEIARIRHDIDTRRGAVAKDNNLTQDQKDAMIIGYTHLENGEIFKVLTPEQRRQVRQRLLVHNATEQAAQKKRPSAN
jgi:hypothetical protein